MRRPAWLGAALRHPVISAVLLACTLGGALGAVWVLDPEWSLARRLLGGAIGGAWVGILVTASKMVGQ